MKNLTTEGKWLFGEGAGQHDIAQGGKAVAEIIDEQNGEPGIDLSSFKKALDEIVSQCWYLKTDNHGGFSF